MLLTDQTIKNKEIRNEEINKIMTMIMTTDEREEKNRRLSDSVMILTTIIIKHESQLQSEKFSPGLHLLDGPRHLADLLLQPCHDFALLFGAGVGTLRRSRAVRQLDAKRHQNCE